MLFLRRCSVRIERPNVCARLLTTSVISNSRFRINGCNTSPRAPSQNDTPTIPIIKRSSKYRASLKSIGMKQFLDDAISHWRSCKGVVDDKPVISDESYPKWKDMVTESFCKSISEFPSNSVQNDSLNMELEKIMFCSALDLCEDVVDLLCPSVPKIGCNHILDGRAVELVQREVVPISSTEMELRLIWKTLDVKESYSETIMEITDQDIIWPGTRQQLVDYLKRRLQPDKCPKF
uniref:Uncharacterized protein n=1 Tax=Spongospora subterranea TaxID=70186 RepID=A0A0H5QS31_9EUKA|eukprot:CRZ04477.1 hypothetical protein [Spongospora subterranea]